MMTDMNKSKILRDPKNSTSIHRHTLFVLSSSGNWEKHWQNSK